MQSCSMSSCSLPRHYRFSSSPCIPCQPVSRQCASLRLVKHKPRGSPASAGAQSTSQASESVDQHRLRFEIDSLENADGELCMPGEVTVDNEQHDKCTVLGVEVRDYPGLLRVIAWVLNGLELVVESARLTTDSDGTARNTFWVTDAAGRKLSEKSAELVAERVGDFVVYCTPSTKAMQAGQLSSGPIHVDNTAHGEFTLISIAEDRAKRTLLLEVASAMTGVGVSIHEAVIEGPCTDQQQAAASSSPKAASTAPCHDSSDASRTRLYKFWVTDRRKQKLDYAHASALCYTLGLVLDHSKGKGQLTPPGQGITGGAARQ